MSDKTLAKYPITEESTISVSASETYEPSADVESKDNAYSVNLINLSNYQIALFRQGDTGKWIKISPPIGKTCTLGNYDTCFENQAWKQLFYVQCTEPSFNVWVGTAPDPQGKIHAWNGRINPECDKAGGVFGIA